jgi:predicted hotdog family 3-hydroxylacyl-ACP dehydratase
MLDRAWIAAHIPHQGEMCLLDQVTEWSPQRLRCVSGTHRLPANPLRQQGRLGSACGVEYAAQAMAVHGALLAETGDSPRQGYLASMRAVDLYTDSLDEAEADLEIEVERLSGDGNNILYLFSVQAGGRLLLAGRAAVILDASILNGVPA